MPRPLTQQERDLARKFRRCAQERKLASLHYKEADKLLEELLKEVDVSRSFRLTRKGKKIARFKHNFADSNTCFRAHGIKEYELEVVELP